MVNLYKYKKWALAYCIGLIPFIVFMVMMTLNQPLIYSAIGTIATMFVMVMLFNVMTRHPLTQIAEGEGLLLMSIDSTGIINDYVCQVAPPFVSAKVDGKEVKTVYDRNIVHYFKEPIKATAEFITSFLTPDQTKDPKQVVEALKEEKTIEVEKGEEIVTLKLKYRRKDENKLNFQMLNLPCLIYNRNLQVFLSKDDLAKLEMKGTVKHLILYVKKVAEELTSVLKDFARLVIELTRPGLLGGITPTNILIIILVIGLIIVGGIYILPHLQGAAGSAAAAVAPVTAPVGVR
jgi:hypothetical protein